MVKIYWDAAGSMTAPTAGVAPASVHCSLAGERLIFGSTNQLRGPSQVLVKVNIACSLPIVFFL